MSLKDINLKKCYSSDIDDVLHDFYIPALKETRYYDRLAGFFSSNSLAIASKGMAGFINNCGQMRMIVCPRFREKDKEMLSQKSQEVEDYISDIFVDEIEKIEDKIFSEPLKAFGYMLANNILTIRIALIYNEKGKLLSAQEINDKGIFHQKVGILEDKEGNCLSFSGSVNESAMAWLDNIEEFKVFKEWEKGQKDFFKNDLDKFERFWQGKSSRVKTINVPEAVENKLIEIAPNNSDEINWELFHKRISKNSNDNNRNKDDKKIELFEHQKKAVQKWLDNEKKCLFEMATGTGKTFAALGCLKELNENKLLTIITCPGNYLVQQWSNEIEKFGTKYDKKIIADTSNSNWKNQMKDILVDLKIGTISRLIILTTHRTYSSETFMNFIKAQIKYFMVFLIADEVHGVGSEKAQLGLNEDYKFRLGLSATPERWLDFEGTEMIYEYFGGDKFKFGLGKAINQINPLTGKSYLTPYVYKPHFINLSGEELQNYLELTKSISRSYHANSEKEDNEILQKLIFKRADIVKNAQAKLNLFDEIVTENIEWTIVYCSPQQIEEVMRILSADKGIVIHKFTQEEYIKPREEFGGKSERQYIIEKFAERKYQALVAMKCLDEGVDIPPARKAFLLSNSGNPREYIQRIGRLIRRYQGKKEAIIHDFIVMPSYERMPKRIRKLERKIFQKEKIRFEEVAKFAKNSGEALTKIDNMS